MLSFSLSACGKLPSSNKDGQNTSNIENSLESVEIIPSTDTGLLRIYELFCGCKSVYISVGVPVVTEKRCCHFGVSITTKNMWKAFQYCVIFLCA